MESEVHKHTHSLTDISTKEREYPVAVEHESPMFVGNNGKSSARDKALMMCMPVRQMILPND